MTTSSIGDWWVKDSFDSGGSVVPPETVVPSDLQSKLRYDRSDVDAILEALNAQRVGLQRKSRLQGLSVIEQADLTDVLAEIDNWELKAEPQASPVWERVESLAEQVLEIHSRLSK